MKPITLSAILLLALTINMNAQNLIAVQNGGNPAFYPKLDSAITHAQDGDTLYIPGGVFSIAVTLSKTLHIVGVGHNPDSTLATLYSYLYGSFNITSGGSNGSLIGVNLSGHINSGTDVINYLVKRCVFNELILTSSSTGWIFIENIIHGKLRSTELPGSSNLLFSNNIIDGYMGGSFYNDYPGFTNSIFRNNIFFSMAYCSYGCVSPIKSPYSTIENNIFLGSTSYSYVSLIVGDYSTISNNLFVFSWSLPATCLGFNNIINQPVNSIFINQSGSSFSYSQNYHLLQSSPGKNAGTDGTDIGIYGGNYPWKEGSIPFNPHIQYMNISDTTNHNGNLNVNIKVAAQDR